MNRQSADACPIGKPTAFDSDHVTSQRPSCSNRHCGIKIALTEVQFVGHRDCRCRWRGLMDVIAKQESEMTAVRDAIASENARAEPAAETHCPYCALQCGMNLTLESGSILVTPRQFPTNKGGLCQKGW